jgi:putative membrane fusion protein
VGDFLGNIRKPKKIKKRKNRGLYLAILIVILYFGSRMTPLLNASAQNTCVIEYGKIENSIESVGFIAREEKILTTINNGDVKYFVSEGERVAKGQKLAEIYLEQLDERSRKDLEAINLRLQNIKGKQDGQDFFKADVEKLDKQISTLTKLIQQDLREEKYERIADYKEELKGLLDKKSIIAGEKSFSGKNVVQLEQQKSQLENKVNSSVQTIYSDSSGFVALGSDGFEELLNYKLLHEITGKQFKLLKDSNLDLSPEETQKEKLAIRIIKNHKWSVVVEIDAEQGEGIEKGKNVRIRTAGQNKELEAVVRNVTDEEDKKIVIFDLDEFIADFYNIRTMAVEIVLSQHEGAIVPNSSIIEKEGVKGVYTVDIGGVLNFKPVKTQISNKEFSILYDGSFEQESRDDPNRVEQIKTINLYDEIVINADKVKEGKRIR